MDHSNTDFVHLYYTPVSPPCRLVKWVAAILGINLMEVPLNLFNGDHLAPHFLEINPNHKVPTIVDGNFCLSESRAIVTYFVEKFAPGCYLFPFDPHVRAIINQMLYFDLGTLYKGLCKYYFARNFHKTFPDVSKYLEIEQAFVQLSTFLDGRIYLAADHFTLADIALIVTVSTYEAVGFNVRNFENVWRWYQCCKQSIPNYSVNQIGIDEFENFNKMNTRTSLNL